MLLAKRFSITPLCYGARWAGRWRFPRRPPRVAIQSDSPATQRFHTGSKIIDILHFKSGQLIPSRLRLFFSPNSGNFAARSRSHCFYKGNYCESFIGRNQTHSMVRTPFAGCNHRRARSRPEPRASPKSGAYLFTRRNSRANTQFSRLGRQGANLRGSQFWN